MKFYKLDIPDLIVFKPDVYEDNRGSFFEAYREVDFMRALGNIRFVQENQSISKKNVIRGLHAQINSPQGKLIRVIYGEIYDVVVDIRKNSPTFGVWKSIILTASDPKIFWIPPGFAHGFRSLTDDATIIYKCTNYYNKTDEQTILWNDPDLAITWFSGKNKETPIISEKDQQGILFEKAKYL